jgi:hypothetical protein
MGSKTAGAREMVQRNKRRHCHGRWSIRSEYEAKSLARARQPPSHIGNTLLVQEVVRLRKVAGATKR